MKRISEKTLSIMRRFAESRGYEFPERHAKWGGLFHAWTIIRTVDRKTGSCYLAWCARNNKVFNRIQNLNEYVSDDRCREFAIGDWVIELFWFAHSQRYGQVLDLKPCNHSEELYPIVAWQDGSVSYTSADFCELAIQPSNTIQSPFHQLNLFEVSA